MNIKLTKQSGIYQLTSTQFLPISLEDAWNFFSCPKNLNKITPPEMDFEITNNPSDTTYEGQIITYKIGIFPFIKTHWITEITHLKEKQFFVDEQRFGPYAMWHHEHHFESVNQQKTKMTDCVHFKLPLGLIGNHVAGKMVSNKVQYIFEKRFELLENLFN